MELLDALRREIETEYAARGDRLGWRLLYSPAAVLEHADVAFVGLNPGGSYIDPNHPWIACPNGKSAYLDESWRGQPPGEDPLQKQVRLLFAMIGAMPQEVLAGNFVPFRSPSWASLVDKPRALAFGRKLWTTILTHARPRLVVAMGSDAAAHMANLLKVDTEFVAVGWGNLAGVRGRTNEVTFVGLPHLSRFRLFGRPASEEALRRLLADWR